jgi:hypothetical protein
MELRARMDPPDARIKAACFSAIDELNLVVFLLGGYGSVIIQISIILGASAPELVKP